MRLWHACVRCNWQRRRTMVMSFNLNHPRATRIAIPCSESTCKYRCKVSTFSMPRNYVRWAATAQTKYTDASRTSILRIWLRIKLWPVGQNRCCQQSNIAQKNILDRLRLFSATNLSLSPPHMQPHLHRWVRNTRRTLCIVKTSLHQP